MKSTAWGNFVRDQRKLKRLSRRALAAMAGIDSSYITLIESGNVPARDKVRAIANALEVDSNKAMLLAGYVPENVSLAALLDWLEGRKKYATVQK